MAEPEKSELTVFLERQAEEMRVVFGTIIQFSRMSESASRQFHKEYMAWLVLRTIQDGQKILDELEEKFKAIESEAITAQAASATADSAVK